MRRRVRVKVQGAVQGVGFRPFVYGLATEHGLSGWVLNEERGVEAEIEGESAPVESFLAELANNPPPIAVVEALETEDLPPTGEEGFVILRSEQSYRRSVLVLPDYATCHGCLREMADPKDRRYQYPFINCTNCGPRYTIIKDLPYDRARTTMAAFEMCGPCREEYEDPLNRRFHAEPTCCPECGPRVWLANGQGEELPSTDVIREAIEHLAAGRIVAVKGLGGFHLACDAGNDEAVALLRKRKQRDMKPFALMTRDVAAAQRLCAVPEGARAVLEGRERPILLMPKRADAPVSVRVAPNQASFGVMLPYTPLHHLLLKAPCPALVMTSGNLTDEPIAYENSESLARLAEIADVFLLHDRGIHTRTDDSVARFSAGKLRFLRRSRGYAPFPAPLPVDTTGHEILAMGPLLSNTCCVTRGNRGFMSHHIGDLKTVASYDALLQAIGHLKNVLGVEPKAVACDMHPTYPTTRYARETGLPVVAVQHHHAHIASVLAEHGHTGKVIGVSYDGLGWGEDETIWGGEFLIADLAGYERVGSLAPLVQPGGDVTAKKPPRMAYAYLREIFGDEAETVAAELLPTLGDAERRILRQQMARRLNCPITTSAGRLFDAASALLGVCVENTYQGQAPMELEALAHEAEDECGFYTAAIHESPDRCFTVATPEIIRQLVADIRDGAKRAVCAARFHNSMVQCTVNGCRKLRERTGLATVALSGGVFANAFLVDRLVPALEADAFEVLLNNIVPPGDGGVSLGQAAVAAWRLTCA